MGWASSWAIFSSTHPVTLLTAKTPKLTAAYTLNSHTNAKDRLKCVTRKSFPAFPVNPFLLLLLLLLFAEKGIPTWVCQMVRFQTKNTNLGKFWRVLRWKMLV
jgi:hypothetical protein